MNHCLTKAFNACIVMLGLWLALPAFAQEPAQFDTQTQTSTTAASGAATATTDDGWHVSVSPYLWFAGLSGTAGILGHDANIKASPGDLLDHFDLGFMALTEIRKGRIVVPIDFMWMRLVDSKGTPFDPGVSYVTVKPSQTILTPAIGYRIVDGEKVKLDAQVGIRYWHLSQSFTFQPSGVVPDQSASADWVDAVAGAKMEAALAPRVLVTIEGDAGAGGANSDYQAVGLLGFRVAKKVILQAGWRYLSVNYRTNPPAMLIYDTHLSGALAGVTFNFK